MFAYTLFISLALLSCLSGAKSLEANVVYLQTESVEAVTATSEQLHHLVKMKRAADEFIKNENEKSGRSDKPEEDLVKLITKPEENKSTTEHSLNGDGVGIFSSGNKQESDKNGKSIPDDVYNELITNPNDDLNYTNKFNVPANSNEKESAEKKFTMEGDQEAKSTNNETLNNEIRSNGEEPNQTTSSTTSTTTSSSVIINTLVPSTDNNRTGREMHNDHQNKSTTSSSDSIHNAIITCVVMFLASFLWIFI